MAYGATRVLDGVSFTVPEGRIVALLGGNGSGKSTVLNTLSGLLRPKRGAVLLNGRITPGGRRMRSCGPAWRRCRRGARSLPR